MTPLGVELVKKTGLIRSIDWSFEKKNMSAQQPCKEQARVKLLQVALERSEEVTFVLSNAC